MSAPIPRDEWHLDTQRLGRRVLVFDRVDSTNTLAAALAHHPANDGLVLLADAQTAGRGQHGRSWTSPPGSSVLLSVLLFPPPELCRPPLLTAWAAVSVCETIRRTADLQAKIKWPNDVLIRGRKVCGILIEAARVRSADCGSRIQEANRSAASFVVAGIGLNVSQSAEELEKAGLTEATSLALSAGKRLEREETARQLIHQLDEEYDRMCRGDVSTLESCWSWRLGLLGRQVAAECAEATHHGRLVELGWEAVELEQADGTVLRLRPEGVRHLGPA
jgi:BirA family transcriptional regulator, biotin operon repressor / biotin---[acetyl-CoA-carboxylase] ligase